MKESIDTSAVTRITVVGRKGLVFEEYDLYQKGCILEIQDNGKTLKIFPRTAKDNFLVEDWLY